MSALFEVTRTDGRSDAQVIADVVRGGEPGHLYPYAELAEALDTGTDRMHTIGDVCRAVRNALPRVLKEQQRRLHNVRMTGFRLAPASEHVALAQSDKRRADVQLRRGLMTLKNVVWDEMDANARAAHEGHLMLTEALYSQMAAQERRLRKVETAIASLR